MHVRARLVCQMSTSAAPPLCRARLLRATGPHIRPMPTRIRLCTVRHAHSARSMAMPVPHVHVHVGLELSIARRSLAERQKKRVAMSGGAVMLRWRHSSSRHAQTSIASSAGVRRFERRTLRVSGSRHVPRAPTEGARHKWLVEKSSRAVEGAVEDEEAEVPERGSLACQRDRQRDRQRDCDEAERRST
jgi:hypothetical protein